MGWSNYIVIHDWKMLVEISRYCSDEWLSFLKSDLDSLDGLLEDMTPFLDDDVKFKDLSAKEIMLRYVISEKTLDILRLADCYLFVYMFMFFLNSRNITWELKSEFDIDFKEEYKDWLKVDRVY